MILLKHGLAGIFSRFTLILITISLFLSILHTDVSAQNAPILINDSSYDFILESLGESIGEDLSLTINDNDVKEIIKKDENKYYTYGTRHKFQISERSVIAVVVRPVEPSFYDQENTAAFHIRLPSNENYLTTAKETLIFDTSQIGEYEIQLKSDISSSYSISIYRLKSPFVGKLSFIGPNTDFSYFQKEYQEFIDHGGNAIMYSNEEAEEYYKVNTTLTRINESEQTAGTKTDTIFDSYYTDSDLIYQISSDLANIPLVEYKNIGLALLFLGSEDKGNVVFLNPAVFSLESKEIQEFMYGLNSQLFKEKITALSYDFSHNYKFVFISATLCFLIFFLILGKELRSFTTEKNYFATLAKSLKQKKSQISSLLLIINVLLIIAIFSVLAILYYFSQKYASGELDYNLTGSIRSFILFSNNWNAVDNYLTLALIAISIILTIDFLLIAWIRWDFVIEIRDTILRRFFGSLKEENRILLSKILLCLFTILTIFFLIIKVLEIDISFKITLLISIFVSASLLLMSRQDSRIVKMHKVISNTVKVLLVICPLLIFVNILNSYFSFFGLNRYYEYNLEQINSLRNRDSSFSFKYEENEYEIQYTPDFQKEDVHTTITQNLRGSNEIYLDISEASSGNIMQDKVLFFDKDIAAFPYKNKVEDFYIYSRQDIPIEATLADILQNSSYKNSLIGVEAKLVSNSKSFDKQIHFNTSYLDSRETNYNKKATYDLDIQGETTFFTVVDDFLDLNITYDDENLRVGRDGFLIKIEADSYEEVYTEFVEDDNKPLYSASYNNSIHIKTDNLEKGVYKITISPTASNIDIGELTTDIVIRNITLNSDKLVLSSSMEHDLNFREPKTLYFYPLESQTSSAPAINANTFIEYSSDSLDENKLENISNNNIGLDNLTTVELIYPYEKLESRYNFYAFTPESYFNPYQYYLTEIDLSNDLIISSSNLKIEEGKASEYIAQIDLPSIDYSYGEALIFTFYTNKYPNRHHNYLTDNITFEMKGN